MIDYGELIKEIREREGLTQVELAEITGMTQGYIGHVENGKVKIPGIDFISKLVVELGIDPYEFIIGSDKRTKTKGEPSELTKLRVKVMKYEKLIKRLNDEMKA